MLPVELADRTTAWQSYVLTLAPGVDRGRVAADLRARGIQCNIGTYASHLQPIYGERAAARCRPTCSRVTSPSPCTPI